VTFTANGTEVSSQSALPAYTEAYRGSAGTSTITFTPPAYSNGNHGHGVTTFGIYTNQMAVGTVPGGNYDTDYYSHFSFVRTLAGHLRFGRSGPTGHLYEPLQVHGDVHQSERHGAARVCGQRESAFRCGSRDEPRVPVPGRSDACDSAGAVTPPVTVGPDANQNNLWRTQ
jgi:hypothetical protein